MRQRWRGKSVSKLLPHNRLRMIVSCSTEGRPERKYNKTRHSARKLRLLFSAQIHVCIVAIIRQNCIRTICILDNSHCAPLVGIIIILRSRWHLVHFELVSFVIVPNFLKNFSHIVDCLFWSRFLANSMSCHIKLCHDRDCWSWET